MPLGGRTAAPQVLALTIARASASLQDMEYIPVLVMVPADSEENPQKRPVELFAITVVAPSEQFNDVAMLCASTARIAVASKTGKRPP